MCVCVYMCVCVSLCAHGGYGGGNDTINTDIVIVL